MYRRRSHRFRSKRPRFASRRLVRMYKSVKPRSVVIPVRLIGQFTLTTNSAGFSGVIPLGTNQLECDPTSALFKFWQFYRIRSIKYEVKRRTDAAIEVDGTTIVPPIQTGTTGLSGGYDAVEPPANGSIGLSPTVGQVITGPVPGGVGNPITVHSRFVSFGHPTAYWCKPMAPGTVPDSVQTMIEKWPRVSHFNFGRKRVMSLNVAPKVYTRKQVAYAVISEKDQDFLFEDSKLGMRRSPWYTTNAATSGIDGPVSSPTDAIWHGMTYFGIRADANVTYNFEVTKQVEIEYRGHTITRPNNTVGTALPAPVPGAPQGRGPGAVVP